MSEYTSAPQDASSPELVALRHGLEALAREVRGDESKWFKQPSVLSNVLAAAVAICALLLSFYTTYVSQQRIEQESVDKAQAELRGLIQRMFRLQFENAELQHKIFCEVYDPTTGGVLSGLLNEENKLLLDQAREVIGWLDRAGQRWVGSKVSHTQLLAVASALFQSRNLGPAAEFASKALERAREVDDLEATLNSLRLSATVAGALGESTAARGHLQEALQLLEQPATKVDDFLFPYQRVRTLDQWAMTEYVFLRDCRAASELLQRASVEISNLGDNDWSRQAVAEHTQATAQFASACVVYINGMKGDDSWKQVVAAQAKAAAQVASACGDAPNPSER